MGAPDLITLTHLAMNPDCADWNGWVFKLSYVLVQKSAPVLEVFRDSEIARAKEWAIYGAPSEAEMIRLEFAGKGSTCHIVDPKGVLEITLVEIGSKVFDYARTGPKREPSFVFRIDRL